MLVPGMFRFYYLLIAFMMVVEIQPTLAAPDKSSGVESLSATTRALLREEMAEIQNAMIAIVPLYAAGKVAEIASIAKQIKNGYILKQQLSAAQKLELAHRLPASFLQIDEKFHYYAGMLETAALNNNQELIGFYFTRLAESCSACHAQHATHRFPDFLENTMEKEHKH